VTLKHDKITDIAKITPIFRQQMINLGGLLIVAEEGPNAHLSSVDEI